jgi:hypothetical protein
LTVQATGSSYNSGTGVVQLNLSGAPTFGIGALVTVSGLTGTGANLASANGNQFVTAISGSLVSFVIASGLTISTITGGTLLGPGLSIRFLGTGQASTIGAQSFSGAYMLDRHLATPNNTANVIIEKLAFSGTGFTGMIRVGSCQSVVIRDCGPLVGVTTEDSPGNSSKVVLIENCSSPSGGFLTGATGAIIGCNFTGCAQAISAYGKGLAMIGNRIENCGTAYLLGMDTNQAASVTATISTATFELTASNSTNVTLANIHGTVAKGQQIFGQNIPPNTIIQSGSGTSWVVNNNITATATACYTSGVMNVSAILSGGPLIIGQRLAGANINTAGSPQEIWIKSQFDGTPGSTGNYTLNGLTKTLDGIFYATIIGTSMTVDSTVTGAAAAGQIILGQISQENTLLTSGTGPFTVNPSQTNGSRFNGTVVAGSTTSTLTINSGLTGVVAIGQTLFGTSVPANTVIISGSGSTWTVNTVFSAGPESMSGDYIYYGIAPLNLSSQTINIIGNDRGLSGFCIIGGTTEGDWCSLDFAGTCSGFYIGAMNFEGHPNSNGGLVNQQFDASIAGTQYGILMRKDKASYGRIDTISAGNVMEVATFEPETASNRTGVVINNMSLTSAGLGPIFIQPNNSYTIIAPTNAGNGFGELAWTVSQLGTGSNVVEGEQFLVTDSNTASWGVNVSGSSSNRVWVRYNGTNYTVVAK